MVLGKQRLEVKRREWLLGRLGSGEIIREAERGMLRERREYQM